MNAPIPTLTPNWRVATPAGRTSFVLLGDAPEAIAHVHGPFHRSHAELIAEAPRMLDTLRQAEETLGNNLTWLYDQLDLSIRQGDRDVITRLEAIKDAWFKIVTVLHPLKQNATVDRS